MSSYNGKMGKGYGKTLRALKRAEAEDRNARTPEHLRKAYRLGPVPSDGVRTDRSIRRYREDFHAEHGVIPEIAADDIENPNAI